MASTSPTPTVTTNCKSSHEWKKRSPALDQNCFLEGSDIKIENIKRLKVDDLKKMFPAKSKDTVNDLINNRIYRFVENEELIIADIIRNNSSPPHSCAYVRAGPREKLFFNPGNVKAGIVTCGGLCPGLNNVIRELVRTLILQYKCEKVYGFIGGYGGIYEREPLVLTTKLVDDINLKGGTILSSNRGGFDEARIYQTLKELDISQLYVIGGDGTLRGADKLRAYFLDKIRQNDHLCVVSGVPKTIDNDIDLIDQSFGFSTAVTEALRAIESANTEAKCVPNGIGIVKLMGRHAGFIAVHATLASGNVDLCLLPEAPVVLDGTKGIYTHLSATLTEKGHAVVVVAEGAGEELLGKQNHFDGGGNRKLPAIGAFLKEAIIEHFKSTGKQVAVKYIDPSYMIRSVRANASDSIMCLILAQNCVHGAMAGLSGFSVGICNNRTCFLPMSAIVSNSPRRIDTNGRTYDRMLAITGQPRVC